MVTSFFKMLLEVVLIIRNTGIISVGKNKIERGRFDMVEFGEQLRRAREEKGMTQQSLAEKLYVTRQTVSRWECGDRYPDLLTTKKISQILEVSLDDLLSEKEMKNVVERTPVIEKKCVNNIMIALYAFIVISFLITVLDFIIRFPQMDAIDYGDARAVIINILSLVISIVFFTYGLIHAICGTLSPNRMGIVIIAYFGSMCIVWSDNLRVYDLWQLIIVCILMLLPNLLGAIASFFYFVRGNNNKIFPCMIYIASAWAMFRLIYTNCQLIVHMRQYLSMDTTIRLVLKLAIYGLIIYQTYTLWKKRRSAIEIGNYNE